MGIVRYSVKLPNQHSWPQPLEAVMREAANLISIGTAVPPYAIEQRDAVPAALPPGRDFRPKSARSQKSKDVVR